MNIIEERRDCIKCDHYETRSIDKSTPPPGTEWTAIQAAEDNAWRSVCYAQDKGLFVAVASTGDNRIMTSPDGINWTARQAPENNTWMSVCYGGGWFVAVGYGNRIIRSQDGINWESRPVFDAWWRSICYSGSRFVAISIANSNGSHTTTSVDGFNWVTQPRLPRDNQWMSICCNDSRFIAVAQSGTGRIISTINPMTNTINPSWSTPSGNGSRQWQSVCYARNTNILYASPGMFVAVANNDTNNRVMTSSNGEVWALRGDIEDNAWNSICYARNRRLFVAVASSGDNRVMTSQNGSSWTMKLAAENNDWRSVCYAEDKRLFVAVASSGDNRVMILQEQ